MMIRERLTRHMLMASSVPLIVGAIAVYAVMGAELGEQFDAALRAKALALAATTQQRGDIVDIDESNRLLREFDEIGEHEAGDDAEAPITSFFQIRRHDGTTVRRSRSLAATDLPMIPSDGGPRFVNLTLPSGRAGRAIAVAFRPRPPRGIRADEAAEREPALQLVVAVGRGGMDETLQLLAVVLAAASLALLGAMLWLVPRLVSREFRPIGTLAQQAGEITADSLDTRVSVAGMPGELVPIAATLNALLARLQNAFDRERQFGADLAHELRTPIAELRTIAELAIRWPESREATTDRDSLLIAQHMEGLVTRLLTLQRTERAQLVVECISVDVVVRRSVKPFANRAEAKALVVNMTGPTDAAIDTDVVLLQSILSNLIENAAEYAPAGTSLGIAWRMSDAAFTIEMTNVVEGISNDDLAHFFDRLWRKDMARTGSDHSGLGLSLARGFAQAMGYSLEAELTDASTVRMTLSGPVRSGASADFQINSVR